MGNNGHLLPIITEDEFMLGQRVSRLEEMMKRHSERMEKRLDMLERSMVQIQNALKATKDDHVLAALKEAADKREKWVGWILGILLDSDDTNWKSSVNFRKKAKKRAAEVAVETDGSDRDEIKQDWVQKILV